MFEDIAGTRRPARADLDAAFVRGRERGTRRGLCTDLLVQRRAQPTNPVGLGDGSIVLLGGVAPQVVQLEPAAAGRIMRDQLPREVDERV